MTIDNAYYLADPLEQLKPQRLDGSIFFGPLNTLTQYQFIENENIELFIAIGLSTQRLANILNGIPAFGPKAGQFLFLNFDRQFSQASVISGYAGTVTEQFYCHNSSLLKLIIENFLQGNCRSSTGDRYRCLTPTPESADITGMIDGNVEVYFNGGSVCSDISSGGFLAFNDLITIFRSVKPQSKVLVFSQNGNDLDLVTFLISALIKKNPSVKVMEAYQFIKSIRPTVDDVQAAVLFDCLPLMEYQQLLSTKEQSIALQGYAGCNTTPQVVRKRGDYIVHQETPEPAELRASGSKRIRFD